MIHLKWILGHLRWVVRLVNSLPLHVFGSSPKVVVQRVVLEPCGGVNPKRVLFLEKRKVFLSLSKGDFP